MKILTLFLALLLSPCAWGQIMQQVVGTAAPAGITLDASCTGSSQANFFTCSAPMTVTAGDTITCNVVGVSGSAQQTGTVVDSVNGFYDNIYGIAHPNAALSWAQTAVKTNSAGGSISPIFFYEAAPLTRGVLSCYAWKGTATSLVLDGGAVNQTFSGSVVDPTSGTAQAPTNNNEVVITYMSRNSSTAPTAGSGWKPSGTLTLVGASGMQQTSEYQIQTTATAVNGAMTGNTTAQNTVDSQFALLPLGQTGGYRSFSGTFIPLGAPGSAPTGTTSAATIGGATSLLSSINSHGYSMTLTGTAPTYDTTTANVPTGTGKVMVQGVTHTFGDAGSSMKVAGATGTGYYSFNDDLLGVGTPHWFSFFYRMASGGATSSCDDGWISGAATEPQMIFQAQFTSGSNFTMKMEGSSPAYGSALSSTLATDTNYWVQEHVAGVNERYHQLLFYTKSGSVWSLANTLNMDVLCSNAATGSCSAAPTAATATGSATSGSTALTATGISGSISIGQVVTGTGIADPSQSGNPSWTVVQNVSGGNVTLSQNTIGAVSGTVNFYTPPAHFVAGTNGSVTAGSTALSVVTPGTGTIATGQAVGGAGIIQGTTVTAVSLPNVTLSIPANATMTNGGVTFWTTPSNSQIGFGKNAGGSCGITADQWWSGMFYDPYGTWGAFAPN